MHTGLRITHAVALTCATLISPLVTDVLAEQPAARTDSASTTRFKPAATSSPATTLTPAIGKPQVPKRARERTIAPFPVPGDTSALSVQLWRTPNLPRSGMTTVAPLPAPGARTSPGASMVPGSTDTSAVSQRDELIRQRLAQHTLDCDDEFMDLPEPTYREAPAMPPGVTGLQPKTIVKVFAFLGEDGRVEAAETSGPASPLDSAAVACVLRWRFKPATHCGHTLPVWVGVPIRFDGR